MVDCFAVASICSSCICNTCTKRYRCSQCKGLAIKIDYHTCLKGKCDRYEKETEKTPLHGGVPRDKVWGEDIPGPCWGCICTQCKEASICTLCHEIKKPADYTCYKIACLKEE